MSHTYNRWNNQCFSESFTKAMCFSSAFKSNIGIFCRLAELLAMSASYIAARLKFWLTPLSVPENLVNVCLLYHLLINLVLFKCFQRLKLGPFFISKKQTTRATWSSTYSNSGLIYEAFLSRSTSLIICISGCSWGKVSSLSLYSIYLFADPKIIQFGQPT